MSTFFRFTINKTQDPFGSFVEGKFIRCFKIYNLAALNGCEYSEYMAYKLSSPSLSLSKKQALFKSKIILRK